MAHTNKTRNNTGDLAPELFPEQEAIAPAHSDLVTTLQSIDLKGVANFAALKQDLLLAEHEIFDGEAPDTFAKVRNRVIARLGRRGKAGLETGLDLIALKTGLKAEKDWVRYGDLIAKAMGLSGASALNHIIRRTEHALKLPKKILSAMIELGLEPIDGGNKRLIDNLPRTFEGTNDQARELVRKEQERVTQAKREARKKSAEKRAKKEAIGARAQEPTDQPWGEKLRDCPEGDRRAVMDGIVARLNSEIEAYLPGYKVQLIPVTGAASAPLTNESHHAVPGPAECVQPVVDETSTDEAVDSMDEDLALYLRMREDQQTASLKPGDRSGLTSRIIETNRPDFLAVLKGLPPDEQARVLDYCYQQITQSCAPAVLQGLVIKVLVEYSAPPLQARRGEPLYRAN